MALCYNFTRVLNILGFEQFIARVAKVLALLLNALVDVLGGIQIVLKGFWTTFEPSLVFRPVQPA